MKKLPHSLEKVLKYLLNKRRTLKICLYISLMVVTLIGTSAFRTKKAIYVHIPEDDDIRLNEAIPPSQWEGSSRSPQGSSTRSFSEMLSSVPELSDHVLFFNRVPKAGSEMLVLLLQWMQGLNGYKHVRLAGGNTRRLTRQQQERLVEKITQTLHDATIPLSFDRHVYFINFTSFGRQSPTYINLVRDPVDKAVSRFYYSRITPSPLNPDLHNIKPPKPRHKTVQSFEECVLTSDPECSFETGHLYDLAIPYFCGHDKSCMVLNDRWALERAKSNVERYFPVVGILEELNSTLVVLEKKLPYFFAGVQEIYFKQLLEPHKNKNRQRPRHVSEEARKKLRSCLKLEYEFYYWLRRRLLNQLSWLSTSSK
ncbi:uronyl 2-sulfotransferase-like [Macrosteles quadrilineatus]|uniref:uronyl 2-sulfotransferase-like n=1 Tax=Macrosteles quadrilineatus TaxID=74068 RepID=UPI0023E1B6E2|nr:uronyl 2-sulfotransferase-like [Macrosteles quadrilineatus]